MTHLLMAENLRTKPSAMPPPTLATVSMGSKFLLMALQRAPRWPPAAAAERTGSWSGAELSSITLSPLA